MTILTSTLRRSVYLRTMRTRLFASLAVGFLLCAFSGNSNAQVPGAGAGNVAFLRIFDQHKAFSATADMHITDNSKDAMDVSFGLVLSEGKVRFDVDLANAKGSMISPEVVSQMKAVGMDRAISIMRLDKKRLYVIYPGLKAYADVVMPDESVQSLTKSLKMQKDPQGKETVASHPCTKTLITLTDDKGQKERITAWEATDLKAFPVQAQLFEAGQNIVIKLRDVKLTRPDTKVFEPPTGFKKYNDMQTLMAQAVAGKQ
ncbi:MAG: hypothetical protein ACXWJX_14055 [Limisphaerales bacterium]